MPRQTITEASQSVPVPQWMVSMEQNRKAERITLASIIGIGLLGLATRTVIAFNTLDPHTPVINRLVEAASNNLLGLAQQLVPFAHTPELQIIEMVAGLTALAGITVGGGKLIDKASTRKKLKQLIKKTRETIIETGNITETLPIADHNIVIAPHGLPFMNAVAQIVDGSILITETWNPYEPNNKVKGEPSFPLYIKTDRPHDEDIYDVANAASARSLIIMSQTKDKFVFCDSKEADEQALLSLNSAQQSLSEEKVLPSLLFLQSKDETLFTEQLTPQEYVKTMGIKNTTIHYLNNLVINDLVLKTTDRNICLATDLARDDKMKLKSSLEKRGFRVTDHASSVLVYYKNDRKNLIETEILTYKFPEKKIFSLLDTEVEVEEVIKNKAIPICIETIMKSVISKFIKSHPHQIIDTPIETSLRERLSVQFSRKIAIDVLRKNPGETRKIINMLDFAEIPSRKLYPYSKPRHFNHWHPTGGDRLFPGDGLNGILTIGSRIRSGNLIPLSAEEIAVQYFNIPNPNQEQTTAIKIILESAEQLGIIIPSGVREFPDGKSRMTYVGIRKDIVDQAYTMLHLCS